MTSRKKATAADAPAERPLTTVGIGASAGGLAAFEAFFSSLPADTDPSMSFVLVQHLAPEHKSILSDIISRYTRMEVFEVTDGTTVQPNCIYVIPPGHNMALLNGTLQLLQPTAAHGQRLPIDFFFRSLAQDQRERAIGIVLSGTGSDGTLGIRAIKGEGGMVMAQSPASAEYDGMPRSAIATGLVDYELPPAEMPAQLIAYTARAFGNPPRAASAPAHRTKNALDKIFILLRAETGHDFSQYKPSTIHRRIERRMAVHRVETMDGYVEYLQRTPAEGDALFRDLLIGVTSFFRDPEAFKALEEQGIPKLFTGKSAGAEIRVWSPGCSTGEEAYSLAMLLQERVEALKQGHTARVFATDIDSRAIVTGRAGLYPASIAAALSPERLARFFTAESDGSAYRIHKGIRDMLVFSEQDAIKDPPFSKVDLLSCRNLLIYLSGELQKKLIPLFHYALNPRGILFLGTSETVGEFDDLFTVLDHKAGLYQRKADIHGARHVALDGFLPPMTAIETTLPRASGKTAVSGKLPLREMTERALLQQVVPAGVLINGRGDILYLHGRTGQYLEPAPGEAGINNILKMAREGLQHELTTALHKAADTREIVRCPGLRVKSNGHSTTINLTIRPVSAGAAATLEAPLYLVTLEEAPPVDPEQAQQAAALRVGEGADGPGTDTDARITALNRELRDKEQYLRIAHENLETSNQELTSSNEEMQSINEELQSTAEEMETSKEELQSVNEELATVNAELQTKVTDLSRANNDMNNLLAGTGIGTVFVDHQLRILRFTPAATGIINLILSDVGRPVSHVVSNLVGYDRLVADVQAVLDTLIPKEVPVQTTAGAWFTLRILPYRTLDNVIEGAVITFADISVRKQAEAELQESEARYRALAEGSPLAIFVNRKDKVVLANAACVKLFGASSPEDLIGTSALELFHPDSQALVRERIREDSETVPLVEVRIVRLDGTPVDVEATASPLLDQGVNAIQVVLRDITERKQAEAELRKAANELLRLAVVVRDAHDAITVQDLDGRILAWNPGAVRLYGWSEAEALVMNVRDRIPEGLREQALANIHQLSQAEILEPYRTQRTTKEGAVVEVSMISTALVNEAGQMYAIATTERPRESATDQTMKVHSGQEG
jgi:two-component system CheB/CheR fusion protein